MTEALARFVGGGVVNKSTIDFGPPPLSLLSLLNATTGEAAGATSLCVLTGGSGVVAADAGDGVCACCSVVALAELPDAARGRLAPLVVAFAPLLFFSFASSAASGAAAAAVCFASAAVVGFFVGAAAAGLLPLACGEKNAAMDACFFFCTSTHMDTHKRLLDPHEHIHAYTESHTNDARSPRPWFPRGCFLTFARADCRQNKRICTPSYKSRALLFTLQYFTSSLCHSYRTRDTDFTVIY